MLSKLFQSIAAVGSSAESLDRLYQQKQVDRLFVYVYEGSTFVDSVILYRVGKGLSFSATERNGDLFCPVCKVFGEGFDLQSESNDPHTIKCQGCRTFVDSDTAAVNRIAVSRADDELQPDVDVDDLTGAYELDDPIFRLVDDHSYGEMRRAYEM